LNDSWRKIVLVSVVFTLSLWQCEVEVASSNAVPTKKKATRHAGQIKLENQKGGGIGINLSEPLRTIYMPTITLLCAE